MAGLTTSELNHRQLRRARYGGPRGGSWSLGRSQEEIDKVLGKHQEAEED
jgi:hypothetical protein